MGCGAVIIKGGHRKGKALDILFDGKGFRYLEADRIDTKNTHGTGCTLSSGIAANLAKGYDLNTSVKRAKSYLSGALGAMLNLGSGSGPMDHGFELRGTYCQ